jgi:quercetin 2,3-dioxygenase
VSDIVVTPSHEARVGELVVRRALPQRGRRTIGAWCFADHLGPAPITGERGIDVGPHPHMGLQTATWLVEGTQLHHDSLGSEQMLVAGELNLMTAGRGIAHSEEAVPGYEGPLHGIQLWIAQPDETRNGPAAFHHHADLPRWESAAASLTLFVGQYQSLVSPALVATPLQGMEVTVRSRTEIELDLGFEYGFIALDGPVQVGNTTVAPGQLAYSTPGRSVMVFDALQASRLIVLGGEPFAERIQMWWNFVGRSREEFTEAYASWANDDGRFGTVNSRLARVTTTPPDGLRDVASDDVVER